MLLFLLGLAAGIVLSLVVNFLFPTLFGKLTRKVGKAAHL